VTTIVLLAFTGLGLAALYFLVASGLSLVFGLADVLNFAHGVFIAAGAYGSWWLASRVHGGWGFPLGLAFGVLCGAIVGTAVELALIRPIYTRAIQQVLVTVGLAIAGVAVIEAAWGADARAYPRPAWTQRTTSIAGAHIPDVIFLLIGAAIVVLALLVLMLRHTKLGLVIRAGVEDRSMVAALGIDVRHAFTLVFAIGGALAGLAGGLGGVYFGSISPGQGTSLLIFAIIVVVIGGMGSVTGSAYAAIAVGLVQQFVNYYASSVGDMCVVALLAITLLVRPRGFTGRAGFTRGTA
jgi:branched-chain amino acid transport system permease protein